MHVVGRQGEDQAVLAGVDNSGGLPGQLLAAHKVLDVLGNDNLHAVVFPDALGQLKHEVQGQRVFGVDKYMGLVNYHDDLPAGLVFQVVLPVFDDLVVQVFQHQQHLGVGYRVVPVGQQGLEIENNEVLYGRQGGGTVPDIGVPPPGGKLGDVVHQYPEVGLEIVALGALKLLQNAVVQVVENGVVLRPEGVQVGVLVDPLLAVYPVNQIVQILHRVPVNLREDLAEKLLQKLEVGGVGTGFLTVLRLIVLQRGDDVERVDPAVGGIGHVDKLAVKVAGQLGILVFRVQDKNFAVVRGQVGQDALGCVGFAAARLAHDDHV